MYGEIFNAPLHAVIKHPENISFTSAAASWMMYITAYGALVEFRTLQAGLNVVIRTASSSVGLATIQISNIQRAKSIPLTRTSEKREMLLKTGATAVIANHGTGHGHGAPACQRTTGRTYRFPPGWRA